MTTAKIIENERSQNDRKDYAIMNAYAFVFGFIVLLAVSTLKSPSVSGGITLHQTKSLKAIVALYIVLGHICKVMEPPLWFKTVNAFGWIDVGVFFFISGYGLAYRYRTGIVAFIRSLA